MFTFAINAVKVNIDLDGHVALGLVSLGIWSGKYRIGSASRNIKIVDNYFSDPSSTCLLYTSPSPRD